MSNSLASSNKILARLLHFAFFLTGISTVLIGQVLPILFKRLNLTDSQAGQLFIAQFFGSFVGVFIFNYTLKKFGFVKTILLGLFAIAIACLLINSPSIEICFLGFFINGIGIGTTLPSINMLIAEMNPDRQTSALNVLNFCWGVGAIVSQPFIKHFGSETSIFNPTLIISLLIFLSAVLIFLRSRKTADSSQDHEAKHEKSVPTIWNKN